MGTQMKVLQAGLFGAWQSIKSMGTADVAYNTEMLDVCPQVSAILRAMCLTGAVWLEQLTWTAPFRARILMFIFLLLLTAVFAIISLLPLVGMWYSAAALLSGVLLCPLILRIPKVSHHLFPYFFWMVATPWEKDKGPDFCPILREGLLRELTTHCWML